jgi:hypothetical protein
MENLFDKLLDQVCSIICLANLIDNFLGQVCLILYTGSLLNKLLHNFIGHLIQQIFMTFLNIYNANLFDKLVQLINWPYLFDTFLDKLVIIQI